VWDETKMLSSHGFGVVNAERSGEYAATMTEGKNHFVCQIVGSVTYLFSVPGSVY
jgi:hypothetical protein